MTPTTQTARTPRRALAAITGVLMALYLLWTLGQNASAMIGRTRAPSARRSQPWSLVDWPDSSGTSVACVVSMMGSDGGMSFTLTATAPASKVGGQVHLAVMVDSAEIDLAGGNNKPSASVSIAP